MPNIPQQQTIVQYVANSSQLQYTFAFYAPLPTDIQVFYQASNAAPIPSADILALNSQYTVTYNADPTTGGIITLLFTPTTGYYLTINRQVAPSLNTNFANAQNFNGANLDAALDRLLLLIQQNFNYITQRNLSYIINTYLPNATPYTQLPPLAQNQFWVGSGSGVIAATISQVPSASVLQSMLANNSPGTDGAMIVGYYDTLTSTPTTVHNFLASLSQFMADTNIQTYAETDAGPPNAVAFAITTPGFTLTAGNQFFLIKIANSNTGASTMQINGGSLITITDNQGNVLTANMMVQNGYSLFTYDGTNMRLLNPIKAFQGGSMYMANTQTIAGNTTAKLGFSTVYFDTLGFATPTQNGYVINRAGYYRFNCCVLCVNASSGGNANLDLFQNGTDVRRLSEIPYTGTAITLSGSAIIYCNLNDVVAMYLNNGNGSNASIGLTSNPYLSTFDAEFIGS